MRNKSKVYGWYGGVRDDEHYVPPPSKPFVPYRDGDLDQAALALLSAVDETKEFLQQNDGAILRRYMVEVEDGQEMYVMTNPDNASDVLTYTTLLSGDESLTNLDGGYF
jgi:hypothetical protein